VNGVAAWERIINDPRPRPKLEAMAKEALELERAGKTLPVDFTMALVAAGLTSWLVAHTREIGAGL
jgi:hypothetical protein